MRPSAKMTAFLLLGALTMMAGCGGNKPDKLYSKVLKQHKAAVENSAKVSDAEFNKTVRLLQNIIIRYRTWEKAVEVQLVIAGMYAGRGEFDAARDEFAKVYVNFPEKREHCSRALFLRGITFEEEGNWKSAAKEFDTVIDQYRDTRTGLEVPLYVASHYRQSNMPEETAIAYDRAARNYLYIIEDNPYAANIPLVEKYLMAAYDGSGKWDQAVKNLEGVSRKFPDSDGAALSLLYASFIYSDKLNQTARSMELLQRIMKDYAGRGVDKEARFAYLGLLAGQGDIEKAKAMLDQLTAQYPRDTAFCSAARYNVAAGFEKAGRWNEAMNEYRVLQAKYPESLEALRSYLAVAYHGIRSGQQQETDASCAAAVACGRKILGRQPQKPEAVETYKLISTAFSMQKKWQEGLAVLNEFTAKYPQEPETATALFQAGNIYFNELKDPAKAREYFATLIQRFPDHQLSQVAQDLVSQMSSDSAGSQDQK